MTIASLIAEFEHRGIVFRWWMAKYVIAPPKAR